MPDTNEQTNIAKPDRYPIICPYCFNREVDGKPFFHTDVEFRSETSYEARDITAIERKAMLSDEQSDQEELERKKRFARGTDEKYQAFWDHFDGHTTECVSFVGDVQRLPWELPIISKEYGIDRLLADADGFVTQAVDIFGKTTYSRVCPYCHNPLPMGYGKYPVKFISIVGVSGAGKTVYISQLLQGMPTYASKVGLSAYYTSRHETEFVNANRVEKERPLPLSTPPRRLSQPMFYDIVSNESNKMTTNTIVLYDIAGENCVSTAEIKRFAQFIEHSDGIILLVDPKQMNFLPEESGDGVANPQIVINTLRDPSGKRKQGERCQIPIAVTLSKSDRCMEILPTLAQEPVLRSTSGLDRVPLKQFDGTTYNELSASLANLMYSNAPTLCVDLQNGYENYNFFAISAIGCQCATVERDGIAYTAPLGVPSPKRIEEPILWLFKHFGYIGSNTKVKRPFPIRQPDRYRFVKYPFCKPYLVELPAEFSHDEGDKLRQERQILARNHWWMWWDKGRWHKWGKWSKWPWKADEDVEIRPGKKDEVEST